MLRTILKQVKQYKRDTLLTPLFAALEVFMEALIPFITASLIDEGLDRGDMGAVLKYGALMLGTAFLSLFFAIRAGKLAARASTGFAANLRQAMFEKIQTYSFSNIDRFSTAGLITRLTTDVNNMQNAYQMSIRLAVRAPLTLISSIVMCMVISLKMSTIFLGAIVVLGIGLFSIIAVVRKIFEVVFSKYDALNASVQENVSAIRVVKAFVREEHEKKKFLDASTLLYRYSVKAESLLALNFPLMMGVMYATILLLSWFGAKNIVIGDLTTGELTSMFSYSMSILVSLMMLSMVFVMLTMSFASGERIAQVLNEEPSIRDPEDPVRDVADGSIHFDHVSFSYKTDSAEKTLSDIDLSIRSGEMIGIIGSTGSGKSTLVSLLSRLYDVTEGAVSIGGRDVRTYDLAALRRNVAVVLQKNTLFSGTILDNLRWGDPEASEEDCIRACRLACADEFIEKMPDRYQTRIDQGGTNVSGGQRQRLCIARALMSHPKVLILDDSTSAVDTATDAKIRRAFREDLPDVTKLIIAQRISSVMDADRILVLDDGRVNGFDTHENLLASNEIYRSIYETQIFGGGDFDEALLTDDYDNKAYAAEGEEGLL